MQKDEYVEHQYVKMYCATNQFPKLPFFNSYKKPHGVRGLSKNYHMCFDPKLVHGICVIHSITYMCTQCISTLDQPCTSGIPSHQQPCNQLVKGFTYWPVLGSFRN